MIAVRVENARYDKPGIYSTTADAMDQLRHWTSSRRESPIAIDCRILSFIHLEGHRL